MSELFAEGDCLPPGIDPDLWRDFVENRRQMKKPLTEVAKRRTLQKLVRLQGQGHDVNELIERSITSGWRGIFAGDLPGQRDPVAERFAQGHRLRFQ